jgi:hypothetical protein
VYVPAVLGAVNVTLKLAVPPGATGLASVM